MNNLKILIIEDEPQGIFFDRFIFTPLEKEGHSVDLARTGSEAEIKLCQDGLPFSLVLIDLQLSDNMPEKFQKYTKALQPHLGDRAISLENSGQAIGLWLWNQPKRIPYCYLSSHTGLFVHDARPPNDLTSKKSTLEFENSTSEDKSFLVFSKNKITNIAIHIKKINDIWEHHKWSE